MGQFTITDITNLESAGSREALGSKIGLMIMNSAKIDARVEEITFDTGEYAVVLRGILQPGAGEDQAAPAEVSQDQEETRPVRLDADTGAGGPLPHADPPISD
jgi:hypothetical protein